jgi:hypothetical protein
MRAIHPRPERRGFTRRSDKTKWNIHRDVIELQLDHVEKNASRAAYNFAEYLEERTAIMQQWADYLDKLKVGAQVIPLRA